MRGKKRRYTMDRLSQVLDRLSISATVFYTGAICGVSSFEDPAQQHGHLHVVKRGCLTIDGQGRKAIKITEPSLVFFPRPMSHRLSSPLDDQADVVCANIEIGAASSNPLANALPEAVVIPLSDSTMLEHTVNWLFDEAFGELSARQPMLDRLSEILIIQILRYVVDQNAELYGVLRGLAHPHLAGVISAIHESPSRPWSLADMAQFAAMSRSKFAEEFKSTVGQTPAEYLVDWRVGLAQTELAKGLPVSVVAHHVGYENGSTLARVFKKRTGVSPSQWQQQHRAGH